MNPWQPLSTLPNSGKVLIAYYAPTNWAYSVASVSFHPGDPPRLREIRLKYARAWMHQPPEPPEAFAA